jgi:hypothetical protein
METPFSMRECYNIWFCSGKKKRGAIGAALAHCIFGNKKSRETAKAEV